MYNYKIHRLLFFGVRQVCYFSVVFSRRLFRNYVRIRLIKEGAGYLLEKRSNEFFTHS